MHFIDLSQQYQTIKSDVDKRIQNVLDHGQYILGPEVNELERQLTKRINAKHCIAVANGTDALQIALMALGVKAGDEVISPAFTYIATVEACALVGAKSVLVDISIEDCLIDVQKIEAAITERTKAIIPVSLYGQCADMEAINRLADKYSLSVIEDAAQSFGATYNGSASCALSTIACTSFFPSKPLGCYGDGGAVFTDSDELATLIRQISRHGQVARYSHHCVGMNSRLDTLQAAVLLSKLMIFDTELLSRNQVATWYDTELAPIEQIKILRRNTLSESAWAQYTILSPHRDKLQKFLSERGVPTVIHYPKVVNEQPAYYDHTAVYQNSVQAAQQVLSLPMHPYLKCDEVQSISRLIKEFHN